MRFNKTRRHIASRIFCKYIICECIGGMEYGEKQILHVEKLKRTEREREGGE